LLYALSGGGESSSDGGKGINSGSTDLAAKAAVLTAAISASEGAVGVLSAKYAPTATNRTTTMAIPIISIFLRKVYSYIFILKYQLNNC